MHTLHVYDTTQGPDLSRIAFSVFQGPQKCGRSSAADVFVSEVACGNALEQRLLGLQEVKAQATISKIAI